MMRNTMLALLTAIAVIGVGAPPSQSLDGWPGCFQVAEEGQPCPPGTRDMGGGYCCPNHHFNEE
ncbi:MAG: hypothetical protein FD153_1358 [Rhodospirillaceae bacterium]|nr:MAG: hypothetical protein FD153_1358 [Rhodospirillaceae bacterium]